ncbi:hypothetical protein G6F65_022821 [Rhizopus arrhizus]|nr:hypothetical protein G6F65_022821 [Rhizopus arrhizus]
MMGNATLQQPAPAGVQAVARAYATADAVAALQAIDAHARTALGHALCTVNRYDADAMRVVRRDSSNPQA